MVDIKIFLNLLISESEFLKSLSLKNIFSTFTSKIDYTNREFYIKIIIRLFIIIIYILYRLLVKLFDVKMEN